jgi:cleavage and polyadenylation specificity factor subunit 5
MQSLKLNHISGYSFGSKDPIRHEDPNSNQAALTLQTEYEGKGTRTTVNGVIVVHDNEHPHILTLKINDYFTLPGEILTPGQDEVTAIKSSLSKIFSSSDQPVDFEILELLGSWYKPNFDAVIYPYLPSHIKRPKEIQKYFLVGMSMQMLLTVPSNMQLIAVPLCDLYDNVQKYGPQLAALPQMLSRFNFIYLAKKEIEKEVEV